ncbi:MAG: PAS domain-containing protein [Bacteroidetes bacterium]|nr:PAS domain-containing protein [Bacteroidota bacterium]
MRPNIQPTSEELIMKEDEFIVSKTDLKGQITYANRVFVEYAGYTEQELLGQPHNIIRHPDMPRGVFKLLWDTVQSGQEIFAYVKNMSRSGAAYWVLANVTPVVDASNTPVGYYSVRRKPARAAIENVQSLYREMLSIERRIGGKEGVNASVQYLTDLLKERSMGYDQFILSL